MSLMPWAGSDTKGEGYSTCMKQKHLKKFLMKGHYNTLKCRIKAITVITFDRLASQKLQYIGYSNFYISLHRHTDFLDTFEGFY